MTFDSLGNVFAAWMDTCGMRVSRSTDGGRTFGEPVTVGGGDKPYVATNPLNDEVYLSWADTSINPGLFTIMFSKSTDQGATFTEPVQVSGLTTEGNGSLVRVGTGGELYAVWRNGDEDRLLFDRSLDGGATWLETDIDAAGGIIGPPGDLGGFRNPNLPAMAVDWSEGPHRGRIYLVIGDSRWGDADIMLVWSDDHGDTWSDPLRVNDDAAGNGAHQWFPWIEVDHDGGVHVTFLDRRDDPDNFLFSTYLATSTDGGAGFGPNVRVSDGHYGPSTYPFLGDYNGSAVAGSRLFPLWPDGRNGDCDVFTHPVDLADFDGDGVLNDGSGNGQYADAPCTGGQSAGCDDNCPGAVNPDQADSDGDGVGDACDNCPEDPNADRSDLDRDGTGDACDPCAGIVGADDSDPDSDGVTNCTDNCPDDANPGQADGDGDGIGDACDPCAGDPVNDVDGDGLCSFEDNCPEHRNPGQVDDDEDGWGDPCDRCPGHSDAGGLDTDGDGWIDPCDCQPGDSYDRTPPDTEPIRAFRDGSTAHFSVGWTDFTDLYSVVRGSLDTLRSTGDYGGCFLEGLDDTGFDDGEVPPPGEGFFYLLQGDNLDCGLGTLGFSSTGTERIASSPCNGAVFEDRFAVSERTDVGSRTGDLSMTLASDDVYEEITESAMGPSVAVNHVWTFQVPAGSKAWLHREGFLTENVEDELFFLYISTAGQDQVWAGAFSSGPDPDRDYSSAIPLSMNGTVEVRMVDTVPLETVPEDDTVYVDQIWIRVVP